MLSGDVCRYLYRRVWRPSQCLCTRIPIQNGMSFFGQEVDDQTEASSLTTGSGAGGRAFLYMGDSKGSRKYEGWSAEGMKMFNDMFDLIKLQRGRPGCSFESRNLLKKIAAAPRIGRDRTANDAPRVRNNVEDLLQEFGV